MAGWVDIEGSVCVGVWVCGVCVCTTRVGKYMLAILVQGDELCKMRKALTFLQRWQKYTHILLKEKYRMQILMFE